MNVYSRSEEKLHTFLALSVVVLSGQLYATIINLSWRKRIPNHRPGGWMDPEQVWDAVAVAGKIAVCAVVHVWNSVVCVMVIDATALYRHIWTVCTNARRGCWWSLEHSSVASFVFVSVMFHGTLEELPGTTREHFSFHCECYNRKWKVTDFRLVSKWQNTVVICLPCGNAACFTCGNGRSEFQIGNGAWSQRAGPYVF
jgi:hypothetical protein